LWHHNYVGKGTNSVNIIPRKVEQKMVRKSSTALTVLGPEEAAVEASKFVPREAFQQLSFWNKLNAREQNALVAEGNQLNTMMVVEATSRLAIGQRLSSIHALLKGHKGAFDKFVKSFSFSSREAYRRMNDYEEMSEKFHFQDHLMYAAMARGINLPGPYKEALIAYPPPRNLPEEGANRYLDQLIKTKKQIAQARKEGTISAAPAPDTAKKPPKVLLMQTFRMAKNAMRHLDSRQRTRFLEDLVGMLMTQRGLGNPKSFEPVAIPEEFNQGKGRPKKEDEPEEEE
jgi:hypothetical protein